jgi:hypothetical protein
MTQNLGLALAEIFGREILDEVAFQSLLTGGSVLPVTVDGAQVGEGNLDGDVLGLATIGELIIEANTRYNQAQVALSEGDWAGYGEQINALEQILQQLAEVTGVPVTDPEGEDAEGPSEPSAEGTP